MSRFATGVTVVTGKFDDEMHGMTCNAFCSVSIAPPTVLVSLVNNTRTALLIDKARAFAVNILSESQSHYSDRFAGRHKDKEADRFEGFEWTTAATGAPIFKETQAYLDCKLTSAFDGGDHTLYVGEVVAAHLDESRSPLLFFHSRYMALADLKPV